MTYSGQASSAIADSPKLTFASWVFIPSSALEATNWTSIPFFSFGPNDGSGDTLRRPSWIGFQKKTTGAGSPKTTFTAFLGGPLVTSEFSQTGQRWVGITTNVPTQNTASIVVDDWMHILFSIDLTGPFSTFDGATDWEAGFSSANLALAINRDIVAFPPVVGTGGLRQNPTFMIDGAGGIAGFNLLLNGLNIGLPSKPELQFSAPPGLAQWIDGTGAPNRLINFANTQIWVGQFIAANSNNLDKFVVLDDENNPVPPPDVRAAVDMFGEPDIWFVRDNISGIEFGDNQGVGGAFATAGTEPEDYNPGPEDVE